DQEHNLLGDDFLRAHPIAIDMASRRLWLFEAQTAAKTRVEPTDAPKTTVKPTPAVEPAK
ncbi:MAG: hypothetical protein RL304_315, partial [Verrucomicrobiota bacterium]